MSSTARRLNPPRHDETLDDVPAVSSGIVRALCTMLRPLTISEFEAAPEQQPQTLTGLDPVPATDDAATTLTGLDPVSEDEPETTQKVANPLPESKPLPPSFLPTPKVPVTRSEQTRICRIRTEAKPKPPPLPRARNRVSEVYDLEPAWWPAGF
jgi:hypothetical protein